MVCDRALNSDHFFATIGGLGLTGLIMDVSLQLVRGNPWLDVDFRAFEGFDEYFQLCEETDQAYEYSVAWLDSGKMRGVFMCGNHSQQRKEEPQHRELSVPIVFPKGVLNRQSIGIFNEFYFRWQSRKTTALVHYSDYFYPLDKIHYWNRIYGKDGFYQFQCVGPAELLKGVMARIHRSGQGSFLSVVKKFGSVSSGGLLSFPTPGYTLAMDFPNLGEKTRLLQRALIRDVVEGGGRVYPAKDSLMEPNDFSAMYGNLARFTHFKDPMFDSSFWRRVQT
jgi:FAD/FMN-containing dehydrogenase